MLKQQALLKSFADTLIGSIFLFIQDSEPFGIANGMFICDFVMGRETVLKFLPIYGNKR